MGAGLLVAAAAAYGVAVGPAAGMHRELMFLLAGVVVVGTGATLVGAWWLAGSAVRPVYEITEQATRIAPGTLDQRIAAHVETDEYRGLVAVLNGMLERLDQAFHNQRRLTADVSHELRSPLTALRGEVEVALRSERSPRDYRRVLHSALEEIESHKARYAINGLHQRMSLSADAGQTIRNRITGIKRHLEALGAVLVTDVVADAPQAQEVPSAPPTPLESASVPPLWDKAVAVPGSVVPEWLDEAKQSTTSVVTK